MRKLLVLVGLCLALLTTPALAAVNLNLPGGAAVNFDGNGVFDQTKPFTFDSLGPNPQATGSELFGVGTISGVSLVDDLGKPVFDPDKAGVQMTFVFWDAVVTSSARTWTGTPGQSTALLTADYTDNARLLIVTDTSFDFTSKAGPKAFNLETGQFNTAFTGTIPGHNGKPDWTDPTEEIFLDLGLSGNSSTMTWTPNKGFLSGAFSSTEVEILGGTGASQFLDRQGPDGKAEAFIFKFSPTGWAFGGDIDVQLKTVPEPATLIFLGTGLVTLIGYRLRRKMS